MRRPRPSGSAIWPMRLCRLFGFIGIPDRVGFCNNGPADGHCNRQHSTQRLTHPRPPRGCTRLDRRRPAGRGEAPTSLDAPVSGGLIRPLVAKTGAGSVEIRTADDIENKGNVHALHLHHSLLSIPHRRSNAAAVNWAQPGLNAAHTGYNKKETTISAGNIGSLAQKWAVPIPNGIQGAAPIEVNGVAYAQSTDGTVYAVKSNDRHAIVDLPGVVARHRRRRRSCLHNLQG